MYSIPSQKRGIQFVNSWSHYIIMKFFCCDSFGLLLEIMFNISQFICQHIKFSFKFIELLSHLSFSNIWFMVWKLAKITLKVICCVLLISWWSCWGGGIMPWGEKAINGGGGGCPCCDWTVWIMGVLDMCCCGGGKNIDWLFD